MGFRFDRLKKDVQVDLDEYRPDDSIWTEDDSKMVFLKHIIDDLPSPQKRIILIYAEVASYKKVAKLLGVSHITVGNMIKEIKRKIYEQYGRDYF